MKAKIKQYFFVEFYQLKASNSTNSISQTDNSEALGPGEIGRVREAAEDGGQAEGAAQRDADEDGRLLRAAEVPQGRLHHQAERERRLLLRHSRWKSQDHQGL